MTAPTVIGPKTVAVSAVDKELAAIWKTLAPPTPDEAAPVMQASVANLVAVTESESAAEDAAGVMVRLMSRAPCRFIVIDSQPEADPPDIQASVSMLCEKSGERQICCEQIRLRARGISADTLPAAAESFYAPDLPVVVWWAADLKRPDLAQFAAGADRLIIDSLTFGQNELQWMADLIEQSRQLHTAVGDLNWVRLTPYRQLFAQFFDAAEWREQLNTIESVSIEAQESAGRLLAGWLLSRLSRLPKPLAREQVALKIEAGEGTFFRSMTMKCGSGEFAVAQAEGECVETRASVGGETVSRVARVPLAPIEKLLSSEIGYSGRDQAYEAALKV